MNRPHYILGLCMLCALPVVVAAQDTPAEQAEEIGRRLVSASQEVGRLLRTVSDRESGEAVASQLKSKMEYLRKTTEQLSRLPLRSPEDARALERSMRDLMHITQGYMPVVQRLQEVNAYGSDGLMAVFQFYRMGQSDSQNSAQQEENPLVRASHDWCDSVDDMLYTLRRVQDAQTAAAAAPELPALISRVEERAVVVKAQRSGLSRQQMESEWIPTERMNRLREELRRELRRILEKDAYGETWLREQLESCAKGA